MNEAAHSIVAIVTAIVGVAIIAVIVSKNTQTPAVLQAAGSAFGNDLLAAEAPALQSSMASPNLSYPSGF
jgi:hypothetical protein